MFESDPELAARKRGRTRGITPTRRANGPEPSPNPSLKPRETRGITPTPRARGQELSPSWFWFLWLAAQFPDTLITAQESAEVLGVCVDHTRRLIREGKLKATRRCNRHVLKLVDVLDARLGVLGDKGGAQ